MWKLKTNLYQVDRQMLDESLYMIGNGYIGVRGSFEEGYPEGPSIRGTYINGLYDRVPMVHAEMAYGFPVEQDKQPRIVDTQTCEIYVDGEMVQLKPGQTLDYERSIDFQTGESVRSYVYITREGKHAYVSFHRLASFHQKNTLIYKIEVQFEGDIELRSVCDTEIENYTNPNDPRTGQGHSRLMKLVSLESEGHHVHALMQTKQTQIEQAVSILHNIHASGPYQVSHHRSDGKLTTVIKSKNQIVLEKRCFFTDGLRERFPLEASKQLMSESRAYHYEEYVYHQKLILDDFWINAGIEIEGAPEDQNAIRMMQFSLLQSIGADEFSNVAAKGLSGEGYEGHYFWDTEIYVIPVFLMNQPEKAKRLLEYRYHILPHAKERALELGHNRGAAYAWRTISGIECSGYFPAGTAQYHINADIAYAFIQYYLYTDDFDFIVDKGAEVILETARLWMEIGHFYKGAFHIHDVTGPDEYTAIVNNNYYTNAMAKYHLDWAHRFYEMLTQPADAAIRAKAEDLCQRLQISSDEIQRMKQASDQMYFPYDSELKLYAQDDAFLSKPVWPFESADPDKKPLLLHYHPLHIYRHQVLKQADTVLAHMLLEQYASLDDITRAVAYYEKITTHDSSLSSCIYGIMASRIGEHDKAYDYFKESVILDLQDTHKNTKDGLHMANMAGTILSVTAGFGGLRITEEGLQLRPVKPKAWKQFSYKIQYHGRLIQVVIGEETKVNLLKGAPLTIKLWDSAYELTKESHPVKGVIFDLDGVLTETSKAHFEAWRDLAHSLGFEVPHRLEDEVRGISRMDSLECVLAYSESEALKNLPHDEKVALATQKNEMYLKRIEQYNPMDLSPGARELLDFLKEKGLKLALASASKNAPFLLKAMEIDHYFDAVVNPGEIANGKPAPDIFLRACELLELQPTECIGIEDAYAGIESIHAAGMKAIGIGSKEVLTNCKDVVSGLESICSIISNEIM